MLPHPRTFPSASGVALFMRFDLAIREAGYIPMSGQIIDASLVSAPKQRNTDAEKKDVKEGRNSQDGTAGIPCGSSCSATHDLARSWLPQQKQG